MNSTLRAALTAKFHVSSDQLQIQYSIRNSGASPFYILDAAVIVGPQGDVKVETARPAAEHVPPDAVVMFDKLFPLPPGTLTAAPRSAYAFRLEPGETHSRVVELTLPLRDRRLAKSAPSKIVTCTRIRFELGIVFPGGNITAEQQIVAGVPLWRLNTAAYSQQQVLSVESTVEHPLSLEVSE